MGQCDDDHFPSQRIPMPELRLPCICTVCIATVALMGCVMPGPTYEEAAYSELIASNYHAADQLLGGAGLDQATAVVATDVVRLDEPMRSSSLGRLISEHVASRFAQYGIPVIAMRLPTDLLLQTGGSPILSKEARDMTASLNAQAVVVGTYAPAQNYVYVTIKLVRSADNIVLSAHNYALPLDGNIAELLPR
jgi:TolB-like protein